MKCFGKLVALVALAKCVLAVEVAETYYGIDNVGPEGGPLGQIPVNTYEYGRMCFTDKPGVYCFHLNEGKVSDIQVPPIVNGYGNDEVSMGKIYAHSNDRDFGILLNPIHNKFIFFVRGDIVLFGYDADLQCQTFRVRHNDPNHKDWHIEIKDENNKVIANKNKKECSNTKWHFLKLYQDLY